MDVTSIIGLIAGLAALIGAFFAEGGTAQGLLQPNAALIVFGGTLAAVLISFPAARLRTIPAALRMAFGRFTGRREEKAEEIIAMSAISRRGGVLGLEQRAEQHPDSFTRDGLLLIIDGNDPGQVREILELEMDAKEAKYEGYAKIFEAAGGYAPTMGIIGTVMGLIRVLGTLTDPSHLGSSIAVAFTATLYGVASANLIFLPIASKIKARCQSEIGEMEMVMVGILSLQNGDHPLLVRKKMSAFLGNGEGYADVEGPPNAGGRP
ncbi:flagellar motor protein [Paenibacillus sp. NFR01]|uniref:flagellar motor protein n=1 Tax=Paenibacillus sp. NFR01 TaxID=1566279 RepID=UPI0008D76DE4|nr:flagellar motor protein [Paenibacillus sp. NFR01]SEU15167.1 chemotaxis protein MotA [Paenibacillus sp. NFR01]